MPLQIDTDQADTVTLLRVHGRLIFGEDASKLQDDVQQLLAAGRANLIVDLQAVPFIDSTGLGVLVVVHSAAQAARGDVRLLHVSQRHMELLVLTKLSALFQIFDDETAAIDSFFPNRTVKHFDILEFVKSQENESQQAADAPVEPEPS